MAPTVSQRELRNDSGMIMRRVEQGESFIVTRNGTPVADLSPHDAADSVRRPRFVRVDDIEAGLAALPDWDGTRFAGELDDLDRLTDDREVDRWTSR